MRQRPDIDTHEIIALYNRGFSCMEVGLIVGLTDAAIYHRLKNAGVTMRSKHRGSVNAAQKAAKYREMSLIIEGRETKEGD